MSTPNPFRQELSLRQNDKRTSRRAESRQTERANESASYYQRHCEEGDDRDSVIARALARGNLIRSNISSETTGDPRVAIAPLDDVTLGVSYRVRSSPRRKIPLCTIFIEKIWWFTE